MHRREFQDTIAKGRFQGSTKGGGILVPEHEEILRDFRRLNTEDARAAFADRWVRLATERLDVTWPVLYELLRVIRDRKLYENARAMEGKQSLASFEEYWDQVVRKPFDTWRELEETYHFVSTQAPELMRAPFEQASGAREKAMAAAAATTGEVLPADGYVADRIEPTDETDKRKGRQIVHPISQRERAKGNGIGVVTQKKLDRIARDHPELHEKVKAGELSVNGAAIEAGFITRTVPMPLDPEGAARCLARHFTRTEIDRIYGLPINQTEGDGEAST
jgi:hypothetical protein